MADEAWWARGVCRLRPNARRRPLGRDGAERAGPRHWPARHEIAGRCVYLVGSGHGSECAERGIGRGVARAVQRSIHDAHGEDCTDAAEGDAMPTI